MHKKNQCAKFTNFQLFLSVRHRILSSCGCSASANAITKRLDLLQETLPVKSTCLEREVAFQRFITNSFGQTDTATVLGML